MRVLAVCASLLLGVLAALGDRQVRLAATTATHDTADISRLATEMIDGHALVHGVAVELISLLGFGNRVAGRFEALAPPAGDEWWGKWDHQVCVSYHPLGGGDCVDPYVQAGYGWAGRGRLTDGHSGEWCQTASAQWAYRWYDQTAPVPNVSLYPFVIFGNSFDLDGLLLCARATCRPYPHRVPGTTIVAFDLRLIEAGLVLGVAIGGHRR